MCTDHLDDNAESSRLAIEPWQLNHLKEGLASAVHVVLRRRGIDGEKIMHLGAFLRLVEQLPEHEEGYSATMTLISETGDGRGEWSVSFDSDGLEISTSELLRGSYGSDHYSRTDYRVNTHRFWAGDDLEEWLHNFKRMAEDQEYGVSVWSESADEG